MRRECWRWGIGSTASPTPSGSAIRSAGRARGGNLISANAGNGISTIFTTGDVIAGNIVGASFGLITDSSFKFRPLGNVGTGISIGSGSTNNTVGLPGAGNLVVANGDSGIDVLFGSDFNVISGNAVGTTLATGSSIGIGPPVNLGNAADGILLANVSANTIGGANQIDSQGNISLLGGNVVSSNGLAGILSWETMNFFPARQNKETSYSGTWSARERMARWPLATG